MDFFTFIGLEQTEIPIGLINNYLLERGHLLHLDPFLSYHLPIYNSSGTSHQQ